MPCKLLSEAGNPRRVPTPHTQHQSFQDPIVIKSGVPMLVGSLVSCD